MSSAKRTTQTSFFGHLKLSQRLAWHLLVLTILDKTSKLPHDWKCTNYNTPCTRLWFRVSVGLVSDPQHSRWTRCYNITDSNACRNLEHPYTCFTVSANKAATTYSSATVAIVLRQAFYQALHAVPSVDRVLTLIELCRSAYKRRHTWNAIWTRNCFQHLLVWSAHCPSFPDAIVSPSNLACTCLWAAILVRTRVQVVKQRMLQPGRLWRPGWPT